MDSDDDVPLLVQHDDQPSEQNHRVPLTIITGFLGAGKTTLLKRILTENHGYRIAVIMNEFGDTADIEAKSITVPSQDDPTGEKPESEEFLELANGCLCCSIKNSGVAAIEKLMQRKGAFDHILLETTGLADPGPIASMFWQNEEFAAGLGRDIALDGVVCVVDAVFGNKQIEEDALDGVSVGESLRQIACADLVLLNKVDLVPANEVASVERTIRGVNPTTPIHHTIKAQIDPKLVMGIGAYNSLPPQFQDDLIPGPNSVQHEHTHDHQSGSVCDLPYHTHQHYATRGISSLQLSCPPLDSPAQLAKLDEWIRTLLWENRVPWNNGGDEAVQDQEQGHPRLLVFRCKGLLRMHTGEEYVLQGVRDIYELREVGLHTGSGGGKVVLIGKGLDEGVTKSFQGIFLP